MQAVILAAGKSQRFYPFAEKPLTILGEKSILEYTLLSLKKAGVSDVVIVVPENSRIQGIIGNGRRLGLSITYVEHVGAQGMGAALLEAKSHLHDTFFVLGPHHLEVGEFVKDMIALQRTKDSIVLLSKPGQKSSAYGFIQTKDEKVIGIVEKPEIVDDSFQQVVAIYLLNKAFVEVLKHTPLEHYSFEKAISSYIATGNVVHLSTSKKTLTLKYPWDLLEIKDYILSSMKRSISKKSEIAKSAIIEGNVVVSDNVKIFEGACIKGPCFLGEGVVIGSNAIVRDGVMVERDGVVGAQMEVKNSIFMVGVTTHSGFIGDSIIGPSSRLAGGFCSANVRFDRGAITAVVREKTVDTKINHFGTIIGEKVDLGVNVTTMPGVILGNHVTVGPGTMIMENVEDNTLIYTKVKNIVKKKSKD